jgi:hypothetical protein
VQIEEIGSWGTESVAEAFEILGLQLALLAVHSAAQDGAQDPRDDEPTQNLVLLPCDPVCCIFLFHSIIPLRFSRTKALSTMS